MVEGCYLYGCVGVGWLCYGFFYQLYVVCGVCGGVGVLECFVVWCVVGFVGCGGFYVCCVDLWVGDVGCDVVWIVG